MTSAAIDAILAGKVDDVVKRVAEKAMGKINEQRAVLSLVYDRKIDFAEEMRLLDEIDAKYAD